MTTQIKEIIAEMREKEKAASEGRIIGLNTCLDLEEFDFFTFAINNITAILDYVAELEHRIKFLEETDLRHLD